MNITDTLQSMRIRTIQKSDDNGLYNAFDLHLHIGKSLHLKKEKQDI